MRFTNKISERTKSEIESKLAKLGDYVKIDYLQRAMNSSLGLETKKFVMVRLAEVYERKSVFYESAKLVKASAEINTTFKSKMDDFMRATKLFVKAKDYQEADIVLSQALVLGTEKQKQELKEQYKKFYFEVAKEYVAKDRRSFAKSAYEKLLGLDLNSQEKKETQKELLKLYDRLGNIRDFYNLKKAIDSN